MWSCGGPRSRVSQELGKNCHFVSKIYHFACQRWRPRGRPWPRRLEDYILKSSSRMNFEVLGLEGQVLGLEASSPRKWPVLGSRTALFFELLKYCGALENFFGKRFFVEIARKIFVKTFFFFGDRPFFFWRALALVSLVLGLGLEHSCPWPRKGCPWPWPRIFFVSLASSLVSSTPPLSLVTQKRLVMEI